ncbi:MAG TPA: prepilin-type N-terminal cleavage/methylation domain-containing protein [Fimbriimonadaceae bacterium]|nr:prepilin-type N-terminal cleavage/methylation domain-containing protein [Fimbriimonadaceae bacterium]
MKRNKRTGFTLVEIMIVVLIIGILLAIAVPNFIKARQNSRLQSIVANLKQIETAKEQWAMENGKAGADVPVQADLAPTYMKTWPVGPVVGVYLPNAVDADPTFIGKTADEWRADPSGL